MRSSAFNRMMMWKKALRKKRMSEHDPYMKEHPMYDNLHQYSKNSIHCSCPDCSAKTRNKGKRRYKSGNYDPSINFKHSELKKFLKATYEDD